MDAVETASTDVNAVGDMSSDDSVSMAEDAIEAAKGAVAAAADLPEGDASVVEANATIAALETQLMTAKAARTAYMTEKSEAEQAAAETVEG